MRIFRPLSLIIALAFCFGCGGGSGSGGGGGGLPTQTALFRIVNNCSYTIWIQQSNMPTGTAAVTQLAKGGYVDYNIPDIGLASTRFWPKTGCDANSQNCSLGQSSDPCPAAGCAPPIDSKFEATWGCTNADPTQCAVNPSAPAQKLPPITSWDTSAVDGYSLPYKVTIVGGGGSTCINADCSSCNTIDCTNLNLSGCPTDENLSQGQVDVHPEYNNEDLRVLDAASPDTALGCYSPCKKLNWPNNTGYNGEGLSEQGDAAVMYCCPTPPIDPGACRAGPVAATKYVAAIHSMCTGGVYAYSYDDVVGLHNCAGNTQFLMTFCP